MSISRFQSSDGLHTLPERTRRRIRTSKEHEYVMYILHQFSLPSVSRKRKIKERISFPLGHSEQLCAASGTPYYRVTSK